MNLDYQIIFQRNYGIFTDAQQERIRRLRVLIIGDTGVGELISVILARSGHEEFVILGDGVYEHADMNRQICCFSDTIGRKKVDVIREAIVSINPNANIVTHDRLPSEKEIASLLVQTDVVIPAVDDLSYSILVFRMARRYGRPAVLCLPSGSMGWVSVFTDQGPSLEDVLGIPKLDYEGMRMLLHSREYRCAQYNLITAGDWRVDWFWDYFKGNRPLPLVCPIEWMLTSLAAMEILKIATKKWTPKLAPRCWYAHNGKISDSRFSSFLRWHRRLGWLIFGSGIGIQFHKHALWFWRFVFRHLKDREGRKPNGQ